MKEEKPTQVRLHTNPPDGGLEVCIDDERQAFEKFQAEGEQRLGSIGGERDEALWERPSPVFEMDHAQVADRSI